MIVIEDHTHPLARKILLAHGVASLYSSSCDVDSLSRSCFGAEHCQRYGAVIPSIDAIMTGRMTFAYVE